MRLVHLSVRNHAAIPDFDIDVRDHLVLVGPNESGKTSLLRLLDAVFNGSKARLFTLLDADAIRDVARPVMCTAVLASPDEKQKGAFADELELTPGKPTLLTVQVASSWDPAAEEVDVSRIVLKGGQEFAAISAQRLADVGFAFLPTSRSPDRELSRGKTSAMQSLLGGVDLQADEEKVKARLDGLHQSIDDAKSLGELRARLATQLGEVLPGELTPDDLRLRLAADSAEDILADLEVWLTSDGQPRPLTGQSDGFRALATVVIQLLADDGTSIVAVDEPETHLHPAAQRRVGRMLQGAQRQAIVSTHSPEVLAQFDPMYVVALTPGHKARQLAQSPYSSGKRKDRPRWWSARRLEPLTARSLILVEGIADRIVVEAAADALGLDLDRQGVTVVDVNGAQEFAKALKLFGADGFNIPIALLVDENEVPVVAAALGVDVAEVAEHRVGICRKDLEAQYIADLTPERVRQCLIESGEYGAAQLPDLEKVKEAHAAMTEHCGGSSKVRSAMGLAAAMTEHDAGKLTVIVDLLTVALAS